MNSKTKGFIYGAIAAASYGMNPLFTLPLYAAGMSVDTVLFYRYFFAVIVLGILMKMQHQSFALRKADILPLVIMGLLFSFSSNVWQRNTSPIPIRCSSRPAFCWEVCWQNILTVQTAVICFLSAAVLLYCLAAPGLR